MKIIFEFKINCLPFDLSNRFLKNNDTNFHIICNASKGGFFVPQIRTKTFGTNSLKYSAVVLWNKHLKIDTFTKIGPFKKYLKITISHLIMRNNF